MKKPNLKAWAKRELKGIENDVSDLNIGNAYLKAARISDRLGAKYSSLNSTAKANYQYEAAADAYGEVGDTRNRNRMLGKIVGTERIGPGESNITRRVASVAGVSFLAGALVFLSVQITGNSILKSPGMTDGFLGVPFFLLAIACFYFLARTRK